MDADRLVADARAATGLDDLGAGSWREGLERYLAALAAEADLTELGAMALEAQIVANLTNRLRVTAWRAEHPELAHQRIERPIVVLGLPRTGTTLVSELLHRDPANRSLLRWEAASSVPPPRAGELTTDPRIDEARAGAAAMDALNPGFKAIHYEAPDGPTECVAVLAQDFKSLLWSVIAHVPSYDAWLLGCDESSAYRYHRDVLELLQSDAPGRWALKTPHHCLALDALVSQYPDARLVMTHRDPVTVMGSVCSLTRSLSGTFTDIDHTEAIAEVWTTIAATLVERVMTWRDAHGDAQFVDIDYDDLRRDPVAEVARVYGHFDEPLSPQAEAAMRRYVAEHPQGEHGRHEYRLEPLGLDPSELGERFEPYRRRFEITQDGAGIE
jgi:Sulfotransferase family